ncbi:MAG: hypothetical protein JKY88_04945 [Pseudomonadales bacterium]|nr:hypothetical protein [Pseudomonadales bacterium]
MEVYIPEKWRAWLEEECLLRFDDWWNLELEAVDEANTGRGGWSTVFKLQRRGRVFFVKRQSNHLSRNLSSGFFSRPTFKSELEQVHRYRERNIPCIEPVFFASMKIKGEHQAILVTESLEGYCALDELLQDPVKLVAWDRRHLCKSVAVSVARLHAAGIEHYNLYPKHIFVRYHEGVIDVRFIDLETSRHHFGLLKRRLRDIETLSRRTPWVSNTERLRFLLAYFCKTKVDKKIRQAIDLIAMRSKRKSKRAK